MWVTGAGFTIETHNSSSVPFQCYIPAAHYIPHYVKLHLWYGVRCSAIRELCPHVLTVFMFRVTYRILNTSGRNVQNTGAKERSLKSKGTECDIMEVQYVLVC